MDPPKGLGSFYCVKGVGVDILGESQEQKYGVLITTYTMESMYPKHIVYTLAPEYLSGDYLKVNVYIIRVHGPLKLSDK